MSMIGGKATDSGGRRQMDSGPEGRRWVGGWHPHRQHAVAPRLKMREKKTKRDGSDTTLHAALRVS